MVSGSAGHTDDKGACAGGKVAAGGGEVQRGQGVPGDVGQAGYRGGGAAAVGGAVAAIEDRRAAVRQNLGGNGAGDGIGAAAGGNECGQSGGGVVGGAGGDRIGDVNAVAHVVDPDGDTGTVGAGEINFDLPVIQQIYARQV